MDEQRPIEARTFHDAGVVEHARAAAEAIRALNHLTRGGPMPAPLVYDVLGSLAEAVQGLPQALDQITTALAASKDSHDLIDAPGRDPAFSILEAGTHLSDAGRRAEKLAEALDAVRTAITDQGYRTGGQG